MVLGGGGGQAGDGPGLHGKVHFGEQKSKNDASSSSNMQGERAKRGLFWGICAFAHLRIKSGKRVSEPTLRSRVLSQSSISHCFKIFFLFFERTVRSSPGIK